MEDFDKWLKEGIVAKIQFAMVVRHRLRRTAVLAAVRSAAAL